MRRPRRGLTAWLQEWFWWIPGVAAAAPETGETVFVDATAETLFSDASAICLFVDATAETLFENA